MGDAHRTTDGRRTLVVHIGLPKTGSISIQHMLRTFRHRLGEFGVHVPAAGFGHTGSHHNLAFEALQIGWYQPRLGGWTDLLRELTAHGAARCFVLSCEIFAHRPAVGKVIDFITAVADAADLNVEIVAYIRPQYESMDAEYGQRVKVGACGARFETYLDAEKRVVDNDYNVRFEPWRAAFEGSVAVYPLEPARMPEGLPAHFLAVLGAAELAAGARALPRLNRRIGAKQLEVLRLVALILRQEMVDVRMVRRLMAELRRRLPAVLPDDAPYSGIGPDERRTVVAHFAKGNARFARSYGIDSEGRLFRDTPPNAARPANLVNWTDFTDTERTAVIRVVRRTIGVELAEKVTRCRIMARSDLMVRSPLPDPKGARGVVPTSGPVRVGRVLTRASRRVLPGWLLRIARKTRSQLAVREYRYFMIRSALMNLAPRRPLPISLRGMRRLAVRATIAVRAGRAVRVVAGRVPPPLRARRELRLLAGMVNLLDHGVEVKRIAEAARGCLELKSRSGDWCVERLVRRAIGISQRRLLPGGARPLSPWNQSEFTRDPRRAFQEWRATELYRARCAAMRRRADEKKLAAPVRRPERPRVLFVAHRQWNFLRDLIADFREEADVRTLSLADVPEAFGAGSLFAESVRESPAARRSRTPTPESWHGRLMAWADIVFVEWCDRSAVWMSHRVPSEKKLVVRLHSYEAFSEWPHLVDWENVDHLLMVGKHMQRFLLEQVDPREFGGTRLATVPNVKRLERYRRPKLPSARRVLGLVGFSRSRKNPLMAVRILQALRQRDTSWTLALVGRYWDDGVHGQEHVDARRGFERYVEDAGLEDAIEWQPFTSSVEDVLLRIGFILSTSEQESMHEAVVEGMASGCVPVVRKWPIAKPWVTSWQYDAEWLFETPEEAAGKILAWERSFDRYSQRAQQEAFAKWDRAVVLPRLKKAVLA